MSESNKEQRHKDNIEDLWKGLGAVKKRILGTIPLLSQAHQQGLTTIVEVLGGSVEAYYIAMFRRGLVKVVGASFDSSRPYDFFWWDTHRSTIYGLTSGPESFGELLPILEAEIAEESEGLENSAVDKKFFERFPERLWVPWFKTETEFNVKVVFTRDEMKKMLTLGEDAFEDFVEGRLAKIRERRIREQIVAAGLTIDELPTKDQAPTVREQWKGSKAQFANFVVETYYMNDDQFRNLKDATERLFSSYAFSDASWTASKCYEFVKQKHSER